MLKLIKADNTKKELYRNIFNMYQNELSQYTDDFQFLDDKGYFDYETVDVYFNGEESVIPYIIELDHHVIGIIVVSKPPYVSKGCDFCIQEFFLIGSKRGKNIAKECCNMIFDQYKGKYCFVVLNKNARAMRFWDKICRQYATDLIKTEKEELTLYTFQI